TAAGTRSGVVLGFNQRHSHAVVNVTDCTVTKPEIVNVFDRLRLFLDPILPPGKRGSVQVTWTDSGLDLLFDLPVRLDLPVREALATLMGQTDASRIGWGPERETIIEQRAPAMTFGGVPVTIPHGAFLQATAESERVITDLVVDWIGGDDMPVAAIADLFSGVGTFTFPLAGRAGQVHGFDGDRAAIEALGAAARRAGRTSVQAYVRDLFRDPLTPEELSGYDAIVMDPPRAGGRAQAAMIAQSTVPTVVMVSCNPATFARDARTLVDGGYRLQHAVPVDQFLWSPEVEVVAVFKGRSTQ
ncbi:MAG: class I SAM-dependent RNA methyltransferase, partial [Sphingomonadales bacterium]